MWEARLTIYITFATVIIGFIVAVIGLRKNSGKLDTIHVLVNSQLTSIVNRVSQLITVLEEHGIDVPDVPNAPDKTA